MNFFNKYLISSSLIGACHMIYNTHNATIYRPHSKKTTELLIGEKCSLIMLNSLVFPFYFPVYIYRGINEFHIYLKGHKPEDYLNEIMFRKYTKAREFHEFFQ